MELIVNELNIPYKTVLL